MHTDILLQLSHVHVCQPPCLAHNHKTNLPYRSTFKTHFPITPNHHNLNFSTPAGTLHIHYKAKLASLHSTCIAMLTVNGWILHLIFTPLFFSAFLVSRTMSSFSPLSFTLAYHTLHTYPLYGLSLIVKVCVLAACSPPGSVGQNGLPPTHDTLHFRCSYCQHPSHPFLSTWGVAMLEKKMRRTMYCTLFSV